MIRQLHQRFVFNRRIKVLSEELALCIPPGTKKVLDIGCGDGSVSKLIMNNSPGLDIFGVDVMERSHVQVPFCLYDGWHIPFENNSFDICMLTDVLHHLTHINALLSEAKRVAAEYILIKDHSYKSSTDFSILKFMDDFGNRHHGIIPVYNYLQEKEWDSIFAELDLMQVKRKNNLSLYPFPFNLVFGRRLHFICLLKITGK